MKRLLFTVCIISLTSCITPRPQNINNLCSVFQQYPKWYWATQRVQEQWGVPISVQMAVIYQESRFSAKAKPPRQKLLWIIPWTRPTSAFGYSQATDESWRVYQHSTSNSSANRDAFSDAVDFIGWYIDQAHRRAGVPKGDPYRVYLAYHEGTGGYIRGTHLYKRWLLDVAKKVTHQAWIYHMQLMRCHDSLPQKHWWNIW
jgi:hypothetical protein